MSPRIEFDREDDKHSLETMTCDSFDTGDSSYTSLKCAGNASPLQSTLVLKIRHSPTLRSRKKLALNAEDFLSSPALRTPIILSTPVETVTQSRSINQFACNSEPFKRTRSINHDVKTVTRDMVDLINESRDAEPDKHKRTASGSQDSRNAFSRSLLGRLTSMRPVRSVGDALAELCDEPVQQQQKCLEYSPRSLSPHHQQQQQQQEPQREHWIKPADKKHKQQRWLIPAEHPYKILWDVLTFTLSIANAYLTHTAVRDRKFGGSAFTSFCDLWFIIDIFLNFVTEYKTGQGLILRDCQTVWARYLTSWFVIDVLSLFPAESLYVKPIIEQQNRRGFFKKSFFRTRAVVRVTRVLRGRHFKLFGRVAKQTKHAGVGASRLLRLIIKYVPKYLLFFRNMKGVLAIRVLRQVHWCRKVWKNIFSYNLDWDLATSRDLDWEFVEDS